MSLPDPLIRLTGVRAAYGGIEVLHGVDLEVSPGTFTAILGPNGAGKTTLLKVIGGLMGTTAGHVHVAGTHINGADPAAIARAGICLIPEGRAVFPNLTVADNLLMFSYTGIPAEDVEEKAYALFPILAERRHQLAGSMSGGQQQMVALARGMATDPAVLLLDELSMGLAPLIVEELYAAVIQAAADGVTVIAVEQFANLVLKLADEAAIMTRGRLAMQASPAAAAEELAAAYLGGQ